MTEYTIDTIIIGAGLAGISAARTFEEHNRRHANNGASMPYLVLEADNKIGGRVQCEVIKGDDGKDIVVPIGPQWFHRDIEPETPENRLRQYVPAHRLDRDTMAREFYINGKRTKLIETLKRLDWARKLIDDYRGPDISLARLFELNSVGVPAALQTTFGTTETGALLSEVSVEDAQKIVSCNMGDFARDGLDTFVKSYAKDIVHNIKLNEPVIEIDTAHKTVRTRNGDIYHAKKCVLSASAGVINSGIIKFTSPFPESHREAFSHMPMGNFNKVIIPFKSTFRFPVNHNTHLDVHTSQGDDFIYLARDNNKPIVTAFMGGDLAKLCDTNPDEAKKKAIEGLREIWKEDGLGRKIDINNEILHDRIIVTQWGNNPYVQGGYSRVDIGHYKARQILAEPIDDWLYLAGEAMGAVEPSSGRDWATQMAGAAISGERAANLILEGRGHGVQTISHRYAVPARSRG